MLPLEVTPDRQLVQAKSKYNHCPTPLERQRLTHWLAEARLTAANYVWEALVD